ncbi:MAG: TIGR03862 family flavoprotein [Pararhodobacter sp.]|nr:TIGR03862 family flavoprotein [Pararhodobacter sp.]
MAERAAALVIGAGPAGLMAADALLAAGYPVILAEAKPSPGRKLLMAGKSGLNVTKDELFADFVSNYAETADWLRPMLAQFGPEQAKHWMRGHGQEVFTGSSGRVFPKVMKASPLLRNWLADLRARGLDLRLRWRWTGVDRSGFRFDTPFGPRVIAPGRTVLALGGASWARLGSDGAWAVILAREGVTLTPFAPANMGYRIAWSRHMQPHFGAPVKSIALTAGDLRVRGEAVISAKGLEGGGIYAVSRALREGATLYIDLFPDLHAGVLADRLRARPSAESVSNKAKKALRLSGARLALAQECAHPLPTQPDDLGALLKALPVPTGHSAPIDEAISTAGGISRTALDDGLMLRAMPGVFAAGEMLDWEAPTGGYLLTACLATGLWAGQAAARWSGGNGDSGNDETFID